MDRRKFIGSLVGGICAAAAVRAFPFRVYSFPKESALSKTLVVNGIIAPDFYVREIWRSASGSDRAYFQGAFVLNKHGVYEQIQRYWRRIDEEIVIAKPQIEPYPWTERGTDYFSRLRLL